jgi:energy-coupling factor transporter transmembrane protein EcfT
VTRLDPRVQLAWLLVVVLGTLLGDVGLAAAAALGAATIGLERAVGRWLRVLAPLLPLAGLVVLFDLLGGQGGPGGVRVAARLLVLATVGFAFAQAADGERLIAGLRALHVPYAVVFVLVAGGRFVPATVADLANLRDAARLRGVRLDGSPWRQFAGWRRLLVPLLVTTVRRGLQTGEAMEARAFGSSRQRTQRVGLAWRRRDTLALVGAAGYLVGTAVAR